MKLSKRWLATVLCVIMLISAVSVPVSASMEPKWLDAIGYFPTIQRGSGYRTFVLGLQRYMMCYDYVSKNKLLSNGHYMDGDFGQHTYDAVVYFQKACGYTNAWCDGIVGSKTWRSMGKRLDTVSDTQPETYIFRRYGFNVFKGFMYAGNETFAYYDESGTEVALF